MLRPHLQKMLFAAALATTTAIPSASAEDTENQAESGTYDASASALPTLSLVATGIGAAGMGVFAIAGLMASTEFEELQGACGASRCPDVSFNERIERGRTLDAVANGGVLVGALGLLAGASFFAADMMLSEDGEEAPGDEVRASWQLRAGPVAAEALVTVSF